MGVGVFPAGDSGKGLLKPAKAFSLSLEGLGLGFAVAGGAFHGQGGDPSHAFEKLFFLTRAKFLPIAVLGGTQGVGQSLDEFEFLGIAHVVDGLVQVLANSFVHIQSVP